MKIRSTLTNIGTNSTQDTEITVFADTKEPTGFIDRAQSTVSFVDATRVFTITPVGSSYDIYQKGLKTTVFGSRTITISNVEGNHFIYLDGDALFETTTFDPTILTDFVYVKVIRWDATNAKTIYNGEERHGCVMDGVTHQYLHLTRGTQLQSGGSLSSIIPDASGDLASHAQFANDATTIWDEDIANVLTARTSVSNISVYYRSGADASNLWRVNETSSFGVLTAGSGRAAWNQNNAGTWQLTEISNQNYVLAHVFAMNDLGRQYGVIIGQAEYATLNLARAGANVEINNIVLAGMIPQEWKFLGVLIYQTNNTYANAVKSRIRTTDTGASYVDVRSASFTGGASSGEPPIAPGTTQQYWRGDKTFQSLNQAAVIGLTISDTPTFAGENLAGNLTLTTAGNGVKIKEGSNATMGVSTLSAGTVVVNTNKVTATSRIFITTQGGTLTNVAACYISTRTASTSFTIKSMNILDTSDVAWMIVEPSP